MHWRNSLVVLLAALSACTSVPVIRTDKALPPAELLQDCPEPAGNPQTNGELARLALALRDALRGCNRDKQALREWSK